MPIYWSLASIPELSDLPSSEQGRLYRSCWFKPFRRWQMWAALAVVCACEVGVRHIGEAFGFGSGFAGALIDVLCMTFVWLILVQVATNLARPYLRAAREAGLAKAEEPPPPPVPWTVRICEQQQAKTEMPLVQKALLRHGIPPQVAYQAAGQFRRGERVVVRVRDAEAGRALVAALQGLGVAAEAA